MSLFSTIVENMKGGERTPPAEDLPPNGEDLDVYTAKILWMEYLKSRFGDLLLYSTNPVDLLILTNYEGEGNLYLTARQNEFNQFVADWYRYRRNVSDAVEMVSSDTPFKFLYEYVCKSGRMPRYAIIEMGTINLDGNELRLDLDTGVIDLIHSGLLYWPVR